MHTDIYNAEQQFRSDAGVVILLRVLGVFYPAFARSGAAIEAPILIYLPDASNIENLSSTLRCYGSSGLRNLDCKPKELEKTIHETEYHLLIMRFAEGRYTAENLEALCRKMREIPDDRLRTLCYIVATEQVSQKYVDRFSGIIRLTGEVAGEQRTWTDEGIKQLMDFWIKFPLESQYDESELGPFLMAADLLQKFFCASEPDEELGEVLNMIESGLTAIEESWDVETDVDAILELFRRELFRAADQISLPILNRLYIEGPEASAISTATFYDEENYYLCASDFDAICRQAAVGLTINELKNVLAEAGVVVCEGRKRAYYTRRVTVVTEHGICRDQRRVAIVRSKVDKLGEHSFLELMKEGGD